MVYSKHIYRQKTPEYGGTNLISAVKIIMTYTFYLFLLMKHKNVFYEVLPRKLFYSLVKERTKYK